jgi:hypothetical protein
VQLRQQFAEALCNHRFRGEGRSDANGNRGKMRDATAPTQECEWKRLRLNRAFRFVVESMSASQEMKQQGGLSTPFGWRLTPLKMTENQNCERSVRLGASLRSR